MKKLLLFFCLFPYFVHAQIIESNVQQLDFGNVTVGDKDSLQLKIKNLSDQNITITNIKFYTTYNSFPFSTSSGSFNLAANSSQSIWIYFEPVHNIYHNSELIIQHNAKSGYTAVDLIGQGVFANSYYSSTQNKSEEALKTALKSRLAQGYRQKSYSQARDAMFMSIDNQKQNGQQATVNTIECVYTGYTKTNYTSRSNAQTTSPKFNTEHTFPQGKFNKSLPMRSDLHHLFPTTNRSNSERGNKPFGVVNNGTAVTLGGGSFYDNNNFEPRNAQKGRTARAMMYFVIRYQDYQSHFSVQETTLKNWHNAYTVDSIEKKRNDDIYAFQNNRNPFVDYPQLEERIQNFVAPSSAPKIYQLDILQTKIDFGIFQAMKNDTFNYTFVNHGNQPIVFNNISLSNTSLLSFGGSSAKNDSLLPGEAKTLSIIINSPQGTISESLSLETNLSQPRDNLTIPIIGKAVQPSLIKENNLASQTRVFPNPFQDQVKVKYTENENLNFKLLNQTGQNIDFPQPMKLKNNYLLSLGKLPKGVYYLEIRTEQSHCYKVLIK